MPFFSIIQLGYFSASRLFKQQVKHTAPLRLVSNGSKLDVISFAGHARGIPSQMQHNPVQLACVRIPSPFDSFRFLHRPASVLRRCNGSAFNPIVSGIAWLRPTPRAALRTLNTNIGRSLELEAFNCSDTLSLDPHASDERLDAPPNTATFSLSSAGAGRTALSSYTPQAHRRLPHTHIKNPVYLSRS